MFVKISRHGYYLPWNSSCPFFPFTLYMAELETLVTRTTTTLLTNLPIKSRTRTPLSPLYFKQNPLTRYDTRWREFYEGPAG